MNLSECGICTCIYFNALLALKSRISPKASIIYPINSTSQPNSQINDLFPNFRYDLVNNQGFIPLSNRLTFKNTFGKQKARSYMLTCDLRRKGKITHVVFFKWEEICLCMGEITLTNKYTRISPSTQKTESGGRFPWGNPTLISFLCWKITLLRS